jgi:hypothetical protein
LSRSEWDFTAPLPNGFGNFTQREQGFGNGSGSTHFVGDLNADNRADFIAYEKSTGNWSISINGGNRTLNLEQNFGTNAEFATVYDVDANGSADFVMVDGNEAHVRYLRNNLTLIAPRH